MKAWHSLNPPRDILDIALLLQAFFDGKIRHVVRRLVKAQLQFCSISVWHNTKLLLVPQLLRLKNTVLGGQGAPSHNPPMIILL